MAISKSKFKRAIAKEVLFFFSALVLVALVWIFLLLRNSYYNNKVRSYSEKVNSLKIQLDTLPKDYTSEVYNLLSPYFVIYYKIGDDTSIITKEQEKEYWILGLPQKVTILQVPSAGYLNKVNRVIVKPEVTIYFLSKGDLGKKVKQIYPQYDDITDIELGNKVLKKFDQQTDSTIAFVFVSINKFREFLNSEDYVVKLYTIFSGSTAPNGAGNISQNKSKPKFDPLRPYNVVFDLGTLSEFKTNMNKGLRYNQVKKRIETDIQRQQELVSSSKESLLTSKDIYSILFNVLLVIGLLLYPVRLSILSILWAYKTLKQEK